MGIDSKFVPDGLAALGADSQNGIFKRKVESELSEEFRCMAVILLSILFFLKKKLFIPA